MPQQTSANTYWAKLPKARLAEALDRKRKDFLDLLDSSGLYNRICRALNLYHGNAHSGEHTDLKEPIRLSGPEGTELDISLNAYRSSLSLLKTYITSQKLEFDAIATGNDAHALCAAKKGNEILDATLLDPSTGLERGLSQAVEDALVTTMGFVWNLWDPTLGPERDADPETMTIQRRGALRHLNPSVTDVVYDPFIRDFGEARWVEVRRQENRWDLAAELGNSAAARAIREAPSGAGSKYDRYDFSIDRSRKDRDYVWVSYFYHARTPALPDGRFVRRVGETILEDDILIDEHIPVFAVTPGQFLFTAFGFTPAFSLESPQTLLNGVVSDIATNQNALGTNKIWKKPNEPLGRAQLERGVKILECETKPEVLDLLQTPPELFKSVETYLMFIERFSGVNASAHGQAVGTNVSGAALAFSEQRVQQAAADLVQNYDRFMSQVAHSTLVVQRARLEDDDQMTVGVGSKRAAYGKKDLEGIERVAIVRGNPLLRTLAGRIQVAESLKAADAVDGDEFLTVVETGNLSKIMETRSNQLKLIHYENDLLEKGIESHMALPTDNHVLHIRLHAALLSTREVRSNPDIARVILAAMAEHKAQMADPNGEVQLWQSLLYGVPMPPPPGAPQGGSPPAEIGQPSPPNKPPPGTGPGPGGVLAPAPNA